MREGRHGHGGRYGHGTRGRGEPALMERGDKHYQGAQTFRRGRAIAFLDSLHIKRATLLNQLQQPEFEAIGPVIRGELKAVDAIIQEFMHTFELRDVMSETHHMAGENGKDVDNGSDPNP